MNQESKEPNGYNECYSLWLCKLSLAHFKTPTWSCV